MSSQSSSSNKTGSFSRFFSVTAHLFKPHLRRKYFPKTNKKIDDYLVDFLIWISTWVITAVFYVLFIYVFMYKTDITFWQKFVDLLSSTRMETFRGVYHYLLNSIFLNSIFLFVFYQAVICSAEGEFLKDIFTHTKLSGLIKGIKIGSFTRSSVLSEQNIEELKVARNNIVEILSNPRVERISIITASGFEFFGSVPVIDEKDKSVKSVKKGYLLGLLAQREKRFEIVLLDPKSEAHKQRASGYFGEVAHKVLQEPEEYTNNFATTLKNIKEAYKKNRNIELRLTSFIPQWKMIFLEGEVWVQSIISGFRSDHAPMFGFRKSDYSLYHAYWNIREEIWHNAVVQDLSS